MIWSSGHGPLPHGAPPSSTAFSQPSSDLDQAASVDPDDPRALDEGLPVHMLVSVDHHLGPRSRDVGAEAVEPEMNIILPVRGIPRGVRIRVLDFDAKELDAGFVRRMKGGRKGLMTVRELR